MAADLNRYSMTLRSHSQAWWDDPDDYYPAYHSAEDMERMLTEHIKESYAAEGLWPPPTEGVTVTRDGVELGDTRDRHPKQEWRPSDEYLERVMPEHVKEAIRRRNAERGQGLEQSSHVSEANPPKGD